MTEKTLFILLILLTAILTSVNLIETFKSSTPLRNFKIVQNGNNYIIALRNNSKSFFLNTELKLLIQTPLACLSRCRITSDHESLNLKRTYKNHSQSFMSCEESKCAEYTISNKVSIINAVNIFSTNFDAEEVENNIFFVYSQSNDSSNKKLIFEICWFTYINKIEGTWIFKRQWNFSEYSFKSGISILSTEEKIELIYKFKDEFYIYYVVTRKLPSGECENKLIRICIAENSANSYMEVPIKCSDSNYAKITSSSTIRSLKIKQGSTFNMYLYVAMSEGDSTSTICFYSNRQINKVFRKNRDLCTSGKGTTGLEYLGKNKPCKPFKSNGIYKSCHGLNGPIEGKIPLVKKPILSLNSTITAIHAVEWLKKTYLLIGLPNGHVVHAEILIYSKNNNLVIVKEDVVDEGYPIKQLGSIESVKMYALTVRKLVTIEPVEVEEEIPGLEAI